jgi:hypothetical protein
MTICDGLGLRRARSFALEQLVIVYCGSDDLRWALAVLALRSLRAICVSCRASLVTLARNLARKGRFAADISSC